MLHKDSYSHQILRLIAERGGAFLLTRSKDILKLTSWAFGSRSNRGPMGTLMKNGFVEKIDRGIYVITPAGKDELMRLESL
jgi:predicted transcriptional regulator